MDNYEGVYMKENIIGYRIKLLREKAKLSQAKLATALGDVKQPVLARYELGTIMPSYPVLVKIADYFDVSADYLLGRTDNPEGKLYGQSKLESSDRMQDSIEMCFEPNTKANQKLKEALKKMLEEQQN